MGARRRVVFLFPSDRKAMRRRKNISIPPSRLRRVSYTLRLGETGRGERVREICLPRTVEIDFKVFAHYPHSSPPQRRGQGWWFAIPRSSAAGDKNASQTPYKHRLAHASGRRSRSERAFRCVGSRGSPERVLLPFVRAKGSPRRIGVQTKPPKKLCGAVRRHGTKS